ncbi:phosphate ABC transporter substrate-binding protein [Shewanella marina]|uniref:phosphate ABC transporter substrate-binding protein n=1 Tax=Shewanella marina TaxID=487319 RepID=UPI000471CF43|nr:phosphate ABC transporter substrate-binding protein [Shewanella marina]
MKKFVAGSVILLSMFSSAAFAKETVTLSGSTSVTGVMEVLAETYSKQHDVAIEVQGTGSSAGIKAANNGTSMFGMASREVKDDEKRADITLTTIARDGIAIAVHQNNPVKSLTMEQITAIYKGEINNWAQVGGAKGPIVLVTRDTASGTRGAFESILKLTRKINGMKVSAISQRAQVGNGNGMVKTMVANNKYAIGYISLGSVDASVSALAVNGAMPTTEAIKSGEYPIARPFVLLYNEQKLPVAAKSFIDWVMAPAGQKVIESKGYVSVI